MLDGDWTLKKRLFEIPELKLYREVNYLRPTYDVRETHPWFCDVGLGAMVVWYDMSHESPIFQDLGNQHNKRLGFEVHVSR